MNISLTTDEEKIIRRQVESGRYDCVEDAVHAAIHSLDAQDDFAPGELDALIAAGKASAEKHDRSVG